MANRTDWPPGLRGFFDEIEAKQGDIIFRLVSLLIEPEWRRGNVAYIASLRTANSRKGCGTAMMMLICAIADRHQTTLELVTRPDNGLTIEALKTWYCRFDFSQSRGHFTTMVRPPKRR